VQDQRERIIGDLKGEKIPFPVLMGRGSGIIQTYKVIRLPYLYIINKDGIISTTAVFMDYEDIKKIIESMLKR
jgi:hypothetical protein